MVGVMLGGLKKEAYILFSKRRWRVTYAAPSTSSGNKTGIAGGKIKICRKKMGLGKGT